MAWALTEAPVPDATAHVVLIALANNANEDGTDSYPYVATIARYARCTTRTVHNKLRELEKLGAISKGDQQVVSHYRPDKRPTVYNLNLGVKDIHVARSRQTPPKRGE